MRIINQSDSWKLQGSAGFLLCALFPADVQATAGTSNNMSPVGMAGEVMNGGLIMQSVTGLLIVLASVIVLAWMLRRLGRLQSSSGGALKMIDGMALSTRERIVLVQVGDTQVLLGVAPGRVEAVHVLDKPVTGKQEEEVTRNFAVRLKEALGKGQ